VSLMSLRGGILWAPKEGNTIDEFEDAFAPNEIKTTHVFPMSFAVADGATETSFSKIWANQLVNAYVACEGDVGAMSRELPRLRACWLEQVTTKELPWYAEQKLKQGAFASVLGVSLIKDSEGLMLWNAFSVGDSSLFHIGFDGAVTAFPSSNSNDLKVRPLLVSSRADDSTILEDVGVHIKGTLGARERIYLVTDALAIWILDSLTTDENPFESLDQMLRTEKSFHEWTRELRQQGKLKNDDYTLVWIELGD